MAQHDPLAATPRDEAAARPPRAGIEHLPPQVPELPLVGGQHRSRISGCVEHGLQGRASRFPRARGTAEKTGAGRQRQGSGQVRRQTAHDQLDRRAEGHAGEQTAGKLQAGSVELRFGGHAWSLWALAIGLASISQAGGPQQNIRIAPSASTSDQIGTTPTDPDLRVVATLGRRQPQTLATRAPQRMSP